MLDHLAEFNCRAGAPAERVVEIERHFECSLPPDYRDFLQTCNGGEGFIGQSTYVILWGVEEVIELNDAYHVDEYASGLLIFGTDGGNEAFGFDTRDAVWTVVSMPLVGMDWSDARNMAKSFGEFLKCLSEETAGH